MKKQNPLIDIWAQAIKEAEEQARLKDNPSEDGGTCNFDTCVIDFKGWRKQDIAQLSALSGVRIDNEKIGRFWGACRFVWFTMNGQGNNRTRMANAAYEHLKTKGIPALMYYQAD